MNREPRRTGRIWSSVDRKLLRRILWTGLGAFLLGYAVVALLMWITAPRREVVTVPDLRQMPLSRAERALDRADLEMEVGDSLPNAEVGAGGVVAQSPLPGREVAPGSSVRVIISTGRERRAVPNVELLTREQALRVLSASGFRVAEDTVPNPRGAGRVLGTEPAAGRVVQVPGLVRLLISAGPPMVAVPALVGLREEELIPALRRVGLRLADPEYRFAPDGEPGLVLDQRPAPGDSVRMGAAVRAVIATQQPPDSVPPAVQEPPVGAGRN